MNAYRKEVLPYMRQSYLKELPSEEWTDLEMARPPSKVWLSNRFMVQLYEQNEHTRLTVSMVKQKESGHWVDGISWDELQRLKKEAGFGDWWGIEIYPAEDCKVTTCNMRHLWLTRKPPECAWVTRGEAT